MTYFDVSTDYYVIYNKKIFEENKLEVPTTFAEFEEVCQTLLDNEVTPIYEHVQTAGIRLCGLLRSAENMRILFRIL